MLQGAGGGGPIESAPRRPKATESTTTSSIAAGALSDAGRGDVVAVRRSRRRAPAFPARGRSRPPRPRRPVPADVSCPAYAGVTVRDRARQFQARLTVDLAGNPSPLSGIRLADVEVGGTRFRFVTTHLESESPEVARAPAAELLAGPSAATTEPVVLAGDLNSAADPPDPAYAVLTDGGFADTWRGAAGPGFTFGLSETLAARSELERRIDYGGPAAAPRRARAEQSRDHGDERPTGTRDRTVAVGPAGWS